MNVIYKGLLALSLLSSSCFAADKLPSIGYQSCCASSQSLASMMEDVPGTPCCFPGPSPVCDESSMAQITVHLINSTAFTIDIWDVTTGKINYIRPTTVPADAQTFVCYGKDPAVQLSSERYHLKYELTKAGQFVFLTITNATPLQDSIELEEKDTEDESKDFVAELPDKDQILRRSGVSTPAGGWSPVPGSPVGRWSPGRGAQLCPGWPQNNHLVTCTSK
ncbi:hypothetical protein FJ365_01145 [Candidatus Dependentiae bacterium]|nr:hypothetical protein [Candidatus Dependentiae bacterium]